MRASPILGAIPVGAMSGKLTSRFSFHVNDSLAAKVRMRAKAFPSMNAYLTHAITSEIMAEDMRVDLEIAASLRRAVELALHKCVLFAPLLLA